jgi:hypothetical protein
VRAGWRAGYSLEAQHITVDPNGNAETAEEQIRGAARYTKFRLDPSGLLDYRSDHRTRYGWSEPDIERLYQEKVPADLRSWLESEFSRSFELGTVAHALAPHDVRRLAVKFTPALLRVEWLHDAIAGVKSRQQAANTRFDYELSLAGGETITRARELTFCLHWLQARGRPPQSVVPNLALLPGLPYPETTRQQLEYLHGRGWDEVAEYTGVVYPGKPLAELQHRVSELSAIARHFGAMLTVEGVSGKQAAVLQLLGSAAGGRISLAVSADDRPLTADPQALPAWLVSLADSLRS